LVSGSVPHESVRVLAEEGVELSRAVESEGRFLGEAGEASDGLKALVPDPFAGFLEICS
jgi:hypothetical protein